MRTALVGDLEHPSLDHVLGQVLLLQHACERRCAELQRASARLIHCGRPSQQATVKNKARDATGKPSVVRKRGGAESELRRDPACPRGEGRGPKAAPDKPHRGGAPANHAQARIQQKQAQREEARPTHPQ